MKLTKKMFYNYLIDCLGYGENELDDIYKADGLAGLTDLLSDDSGIIEYNS